MLHKLRHDSEVFCSSNFWWKFTTWLATNHNVLGVDHIFIRLGPTPPTPSSLPGPLSYTCVGPPPHLEPMWRYTIKFTNIQADITFIILKLIDGVPSHAKGA